jgi:hypothetical protein
MNKSDRFPFEPNSRPKKSKDLKKPPEAVTAKSNASKPANKPPANKSVSKPASKASVSPAPSKVTNKVNPSNAKRDSLGIPDEVNRRIVRRAALFCGIPTALGLSTFIISYFLVSKHIVDLPTSAVVLLSMLFLGLGVVGLSYGAISASWDLGRVGSWWGYAEFRTNFGYLTQAWKSQQQIAKGDTK